MCKKHAAWKKNALRSVIGEWGSWPLMTLYKCMLLQLWRKTRFVQLPMNDCIALNVYIFSLTHCTEEMERVTMQCFASVVSEPINSANLDCSQNRYAVPVTLSLQFWVPLFDPVVRIFRILFRFFNISFQFTSVSFVSFLKIRSYLVVLVRSEQESDFGKSIHGRDG